VFSTRILEQRFADRSASGIYTNFTANAAWIASGQRRKWEKSQKRREKTALRSRQVTMGK
jgi:hypothetical protein